MRPTTSTPGVRPAFILNRNAGKFLRRPALEGQLVRAIGARGDVFATTSGKDLAAAARRVVELGSSPVVLCGGDGTYLAGVTALVKSSAGQELPPLVLARGGTVSIVARNWGSPSDLVATVLRVAKAPSSLEFSARPTLAVSAAGETRIGFTFGTGLVARFFTEYEQAGAGGNGTALAIALRLFIDSLRRGPYATRILSPLPCRVTADGTTLEPRAFSLVVASVLRDVGLHLLVTHRGGEDPLRPHLVASPLAPGALGPQWPRVALGRPLLGMGNFDGLVTDFRVDFPGDDGPYVLDGDTFRARSVTVSAGPTIRIAR